MGAATIPSRTAGDAVRRPRGPSPVLPIVLSILAAARPGEAAQTVRPEDTARGVTVATRLRPDYDPASVRLPGLRLDAAVEGGAGFDDNLLPGRGARRSGAFATESLAVSAGTTWTRHALGLSATQSTRQYVQDSELNWTDYGVIASGRYDIGRASWLAFRYEHQRGHIEVDNFDLQREGSLVPVPFDTDVANLAGRAEINRVRLGASADLRAFRYEDVTFRGFRDQVSTSDRREATGEVTADYRFLPDRYVLTLFRVQDIRYDRTGQRGRDSLTLEAQAGLDYALTGLWRARFLFGYRERDYEGAGIRSLSGPAFEAQVTYLPSQLTTLNLTLQRTIEESIRVASVSYTRTAARLTVDHELFRNVVLTGELRAERRDYAREGNVADVIGIAAARVQLNRTTSLVATYQHTERLEAPAGVSEYGRNQVQLRLRFSL